MAAAAQVDRVVTGAIINYKQMREFCQAQGIELLFDVNQGVCHQAMIDRGLVYPRPEE